MYAPRAILSPSIGINRPQADNFDGGFDGKSWRTEMFRQQRVGIESYPSPTIGTNRKSNLSSCFHTSVAHLQFGACVEIDMIAELGAPQVGERI
jgi:hypothetical protein